MNGAATSNALKPQEWHEVTAPPPALAAAASVLAARYGAGTLAPGELRQLVGEPSPPEPICGSRS